MAVDINAYQYEINKLFIMSLKFLMTWFCVISGILIVIGAIFSFFGLSVISEISRGFIGFSVLPPDKGVLLSWESAIYGAIMIGWGVTLLLLGRLAFMRKDAGLMKIMLLGLAVWLVIEAVYSLYLGVLFNVGVDMAVLALFGLPLILAIRYLKSKQTSSP